MGIYLICGIKEEYTAFFTSIQGWANQPSIVKLENLLTNQDALAIQMAKALISENDEALFAGRRHYNYKNQTGNHFKEKDYLKGKLFSSGEQWRLKNANERGSYGRGSWTRKNFLLKDINFENSEYETRKKLICNRLGKPGHVEKFCRSHKLSKEMQASLKIKREKF
ncbi:hypothetical protein DCAR_0727359 [Daucus carota subsp. sativus]|uniref:Uncharacterized protein n=1 Tax=Daucus carota subsp. sativus TaxID=79200 RepID=A0AAF1B620_DAUCS|nr:hypothetical protein DCAR_0727359 [Daucus carota subsp. sativus]